MKHRGYIKDYQVFDPHRVGKITVELAGRIKDCKALIYRQDIKANRIEEYVQRALPTRQWGYVVITTPNSVLDHEEAIRQNMGGQRGRGCKTEPALTRVRGCKTEPALTRVRGCKTEPALTRVWGCRDRVKSSQPVVPV
ncbi:hypothetical protein H6P81_017947 [Aristolochia fimbriata]|uniref:40S ribosomal protein S15a n=1 Tax=Aristolochia fimbriata TaxID=158543 RepID=A0AAV7E0E5_ARIFI|nr:hypothetical protein H6P81_017947 [Aristolochia fimbriata]